MGISVDVACILAIPCRHSRREVQCSFVPRWDYLSFGRRLPWLRLDVRRKPALKPRLSEGSSCLGVWSTLTNPSRSPSPVVAQLGTTYHVRSLSCVSLSFSVTSVGVIEPGISCLLANTSKSASFISRSRMIRCSSCLASSMRARSFESMTNIRPWVPEK